MAIIVAELYPFLFSWADKTISKSTTKSLSFLPRPQIYPPISPSRELVCERGTRIIKLPTI